LSSLIANGKGRGEMQVSIQLHQQIKVWHDLMHIYDF
jgi:hypothetical protein